ncbi:MAG: hypothetical protein ABI183_13895, partial [Polyangiaceae bacterium]
ARGACMLAIALYCAGSAIASCGGKIDPNSMFDDGSAHDAGAADPASVDDASPTQEFDGGAFSGFDASTPTAGFPPVANGPTDTAPVCASRPALDCACHGEDCPKPPDSYLAQIVADCQTAGPACGFIYVDYDADGCAIALRMDDPDPGFVACTTERLDENIWSCEIGGGEISTFVDCTVP